MKATHEYPNHLWTPSPKTTETKRSKSAISPSPYLINLATQGNNNVCSALAEKFKVTEKEKCPQNTSEIFSEYIEKKDGISHLMESGSSDDSTTKKMQMGKSIG